LRERLTDRKADYFDIYLVGDANVVAVDSVGVSDDVSEFTTRWPGVCML
jgi:hypothetical protein